MMDILARKLQTLRRELKSRGGRRVAKIASDKLAILLLSKLYNFPSSWHPPTSLRPYRRVVAQVVNTLKPDTVCEVGCGLGSILCRIQAPARYGFDIDGGVIRAARLLRGRKIHFQRGELASVSIENIDVLILVNWIHEMSPAELDRQLTPLLRRTRYLLLDAIDPDNDFGYRYKHDFAFLGSRARRVSITRVDGEGRSFQLFQVDPFQ